jgi:hypothetical protein
LWHSALALLVSAGSSKTVLAALAAVLKTGACLVCSHTDLHETSLCDSLHGATVTQLANVAV